MSVALRIVQVVVFLLIGPMIALGVMSSLSGGGVTPAFQEIGQRMIVLSIFVPIPALILSEVVHRRLSQTPLAMALLIVPVGVWVWLVVWLQRETGFFG